MTSSPSAAEPNHGDRVHRRLITLNVALLLVLGVVTIFSSTHVGAQPATSQPASGRGRGEYTIVSGRYQGGNSNALYVTDAVNQEILALEWDRNRKELTIFGLRKLADDAKMFQQGR